MVNIPKWARRYLRPERVQLVVEAIQAAESQTSGEIVAMIVRRSSTIGHVSIIVFCLLTILFLLLDIPSHQTLVLGQHWGWYLGDILLFMFLSSLLSRWSLVQRIFTSKEDQHAQVDMRAEVEFYESGLDKTIRATGVLLFVSLMEHRAVVLADHEIAKKVPQETWNEVCALLVSGIKKQHIGMAFRDAILRCGEILSPVFPIQKDDKNELKNRLIIKE